MKMIKKAAAVIAAASAVLTMSGCFGIGGTQTASPMSTYDYSTMHLVQLEEPKEGQKTAEIETTLGTIKVVLYPEYAPNTVNNFVNRANEGFYNGKDIYCVLDKSIFMAGSLDENRNSGVTDDGQLIANEYSVDLWPFKGALCSFNGRAGYGDSRFIVLNERVLSDEQVEELRTFTDESRENPIPNELIDAFVENGVIIDFCASYTVFAQTYEGMDVIEKICSVDVSGEYSVPVEPIYINRITIGEYHAG
jgi:peptidyl-prolyl cis-trans isomerase B (cyclophilin B)